MHYKNAQACIDSRRLGIPAETIFFALRGQNRDGHSFIADLYDSGVRRFVVEHIPAHAPERYPQALWYACENPLQTLQEWAVWHRSQFDIPVVGITGSNGKTIVKEWLAQLLESHYRVVKSPKSYNSQLGVPLSVLQMNEQHQIAIFEAGISRPNEMHKLEKMIQPRIGIITNIGNAHDEGFDNQEQKLAEKLKLFINSEIIIYNYQQEKIQKALAQAPFNNKKLLGWGDSTEATIRIQKLGQNNIVIYSNIPENKGSFNLRLPFASRDQASFENLMHCIVLLLWLGYKEADIQAVISQIKAVQMRLERKEGRDGCLLIDDSYNNDEAGLRIALDFWRQSYKENPEMGKTLILSDFLELSAQPDTLYPRIARLLQEYGLQRLVAVGTQLVQQQKVFKNIFKTDFYANTDDLISAILNNKIHFNNEIVLIKGARRFELERVVQLLKKRIHATVLEVHLNALAHNFQFYRQLLAPQTRMMAMVKAFAYGSGGYEVARLLEQQKVDYLGVAYTDEGITLRRRGIRVPIMVMNASETEFEALLQYQLEPVVYSFKILDALLDFCIKKQQKIAVHIEWDTGMHRLGFDENEAQSLIDKLLQHKNELQIASTFSHLAASEESQHTDYTNAQITVFQQLANKLETALNIKTIKHTLNSGGIARFPDAQFDMVRLGIGLYGIDPSGLHSQQLQPVATLKTIISQIKMLPDTATVGYGRRGRLHRDSRIATLAIGYADGLSRMMGNGQGGVWAAGQWLPLVGNVCMDMCFVDITDTDLQEGDEVEIFGKQQPIELFAQAMDTIPYEALTRISSRVPRIFYED